MSDVLKRTPLYETHCRLGGKMVAFAGYEMPLQFSAGLMAEHLHTRSQAGLFDVSHMGQVHLQARDGRFETLARALERLIPVDILGLPDGRQRYGFFTLDNGAILDDLMLARLGNGLLVVVNASRKSRDLAHLHAHLDHEILITAHDENALLALQGPYAADILSSLCPQSVEMRFMDVMATNLNGVNCVISRSGYTGEDGFEISVPATHAVGLADALLADARVLSIGLGARDSLRLEAGLCLYGNDLDETTTPVAASLQWAMQKVRRTGGQRSGGFLGADVILPELSYGSPRIRVGLAASGRAPIRAGAKIFASETAQAPIGVVTSGAFGPSYGAPVAMGYVDSAHGRQGADLFADLRGRMIPVKIAPLPFIAPHYKR